MFYIQKIMLIMYIENYIYYNTELLYYIFGHV